MQPEWPRRRMPPLCKNNAQAENGICESRGRLPEKLPPNIRPRSLSGVVSETIRDRYTLEASAQGESNDGHDATPSTKMERKLRSPKFATFGQSSLNPWTQDTSLRQPGAEQHKLRGRRGAQARNSGHEHKPCGPEGCAQAPPAPANAGGSAPHHSGSAKPSTLTTNSYHSAHAPGAGGARPHCAVAIFMQPSAPSKITFVWLVACFC